MNSLKPVLLLFLFASCSLGLWACQQNKNGLKSPAGKFTIKFDVTKDYKSKGTGDLDDISYVQYKISFLDENDKLVAATEFANVYGWSDDAEPKSVNEIFDDFKWSPNEDFVILPESEWASAPGSPVYKVLNLNKNYKWESADIRMYIETWYGDLLLFGNVKDDCNCEVNMFDGKTGSNKTIVKAESPVGYEITSVKGNKLIINSLLDNCRMEGDEENFKSRSLEFDMSTLKLFGN